MKREYSIQSNEVKSEFNDAIWLWSLKKEVKECNLLHLNRINRPVCYIRADDNFESLADQNEDNENLQKEIQLSIGSRVMLRHNLNVRLGLVNESIGVVQDIIFKEGSRPPHNSPEIIMVKFASVDVPVPIFKITRSWKLGNATRIRKHFPLVLAYSLTLHKSQGLTLDKAVISIGKSEKWIGGTYVALSRVRSLNDLLFERSYVFSRFQKIGRSSGFKKLQEDYKRLEFLANQN